MRKALALPLLMLFAGCEADVNQANDSVTLQYDENLAESTVDTVTNEAEEIGGLIVNDVQETADTVQNEVGDVDVDVDVNTDGEAAANTQ
jgi:hypothetical protein